MKKWKHLLVTDEQPILEAIRVLNDYSQFAIVVDQQNKLLGTITDGDIRRGLLKGLDLKLNTVAQIMNRNPVSVRNNSSIQEIHRELGKLESKITFVPMVDASQLVTGIFSLLEDAEETNASIPVVVMARVKITPGINFIFM